MNLSVIIVNYNVKHFLEQCLYAVQKGSEGLAVETIVVDNHSSDDSIGYLRPEFPRVRFIINKENRGFAQACNAGLTAASGQYVLFLNPDTIVAEDSFATCIRFFETHPEAGALGVKMVDGSGTFLKESKRAFPSPATSFYKLSGLAALFPHSKTFSRYHLGYLDKNRNHEADVLAGAFMMIRKKVLDEVGSFDETFFMYGEDVDLSYRIQKAGFKNYYVADTTIIHFKGESTKRGSLNYVRMFYKAMSTFVRKHYGGTRAGVFTTFIQLAIWTRAALTALAKALSRVRLPVIDALFILCAFFLVKQFWVHYVRTDVRFKEGLFLVSFPAFTALYLITAYYAGLYDRYYRQVSLLRATAAATLILLSFYALLPEQFRFSRGIVVFGAAVAFIEIYFLRWLLVKRGLLSETAGATAKPFLLIAGTQKETLAVTRLLQKADLNNAVAGRIAVDWNEENSVAPLAHVRETAATLEIQEVVFCAGTLSYKEIIEKIQADAGSYRARFHAAGSTSIVGSDESTGRGKIVAGDAAFAISRPGNRRLKRLADVSLSLLWLLSAPVHFLFQRKAISFFCNCFNVIAGQKTWVGYISPGKGLPTIRSGIIGSNGRPLHLQQGLSATSLYQSDYWYARNYNPFRDVRLVLRNYKYLSA